VFRTASLPFLQLRSSSTLSKTFSSLQLQELCSKKKVELEANSMFFVERLKRYSRIWPFVLSLGVMKKLLTLATH
jgi:hypothetical protein